MDEQAWQALVRRQEVRAREDPRGHRRKVVLLAALGYGFIGVLLAVLGVLAALVVVLALKGPAVLLKLLIPIGALVWVIGRSLWVKVEAPDGVALERREAPPLFRMLDEVRATIRGPKVHEVLVDDEANAGVVQVPRAGGVFGSRNYLVLGLPYLHALSAEQFRAVVAHELGHLSRAHGRFGAFVYRVRATWFQLLEGFEERRSLWTGIVRRFFEWYVPVFNAYTLPLARHHEFEADDAAAQAAGKEAAGSSLVAGVLAARWLHESYWPKLLERAVDEPAPPATAFAPVAKQIAGAKSLGNVERWYRDQLEVQTDAADTHPSLAERLDHLGLDREQVLRDAMRPATPSAAETFLGEAEGQVVAAVTYRWTAVVGEFWRHEHDEAQKAKVELQRLDDRAAQGTLEPADALTRAHLTTVFRGEDAGLERYRELVGTENDAPGRFGVGKLLLAKGDEAGLRWLDEAIDRDPEAVLPACELAYEWLRDRARDDEAQLYRSRGERQADMLEAADEERTEVSIEDELAPPVLPDELVERIRRKVAWHEEVREAYVVRKVTEHLDEEHPFHVVALVPRSDFRTAWREADDDEEPLEARVARDLALSEDFMVAKVGRKSPLAQRFAEIDGAKVFSRD